MTHHLVRTHLPTNRGFFAAFRVSGFALGGLSAWNCWEPPPGPVSAFTLSMTITSGGHEMTKTIHAVSRPYAAGVWTTLVDDVDYRAERRGVRVSAPSDSDPDDALIAERLSDLHGGSWAPATEWSLTGEADVTRVFRRQPTDEQITALSAEAGAAGDLEQVEICRRALRGDTDAIDECSRVIAYAAGEDAAEMAS